MNENELRVIFLTIALVLSVHAHSMIFNEQYYPTFGNTNIHVASENHLIQHGEYPLQNDYSYGGGIPNLYVPVYRFFAAQTIFLTGLSFNEINRWIVILFALLLPIGYYLLAKEAFGETAGLFSAVLVSIVPEMLVYTIRPLPQAMGLALLPLAFFAIIKGSKKIAALSSIAIVLIHQEAGVFLVASVFSFAVLSIIINFFKKEKLVSKLSEKALIAWFAGTLAYFAWHFFVTGNLDVFGLAQFQHHEGAIVSIQFLIEKTSLLVLLTGLVGAALTIASGLKQKQEAILVLGIFLFSLFAIKNDLVGLQVFMDRFIVFLQIPLILFAGSTLAFVSKLASKYLGSRKQLQNH
ncbi:MAG: glycosyltransferase family 39 protein [Candidatus Micrarchaeota archaeon]